MERVSSFAIATYAVTVPKYGYLIKLIKLKPNTFVWGGHLFEEDVEEVVETYGPLIPYSKEFKEIEARLKQKRDLLNTPLGELIHELKKGGKNPPGPESY